MRERIKIFSGHDSAELAKAVNLLLEGLADTSEIVSIDTNTCGILINGNRGACVVTVTVRYREVTQ